VFSSHPATNTVTRNNIFDCPGPLTAREKPAIPGDLDHDLFTGIWMAAGYGQNVIRQKPAYVHSYALEFYLAPTTTKIHWGETTTMHGEKEFKVTDKLISIPNPAIDAGVVIPGFNDDFQGKGPDMGAFETGNPPLKFGRRAGAPLDHAPWEK
jgi:hypothetical protein